MRVGDLDGVFGGAGVVASLGQHGSVDTGVLLRVTVKLITGGERVVGSDLVVDARSDVGAGPRVGNAFAQVQHGSVYDCDFIDVAPLDVEEE